MLWPRIEKSPTVEVFDGKQYPIYDVSLHVADLRDMIDEPTPEKCERIMTYLLDVLLDGSELNTFIADSVIPDLDL